MVGRYLPPDASRADAVAYRSGAVCHAVGELHQLTVEVGACGVCVLGRGLAFYVVGCARVSRPFRLVDLDGALLSPGNPAGFAPKMPRTEPIRPDWCRRSLGQAQSCRRSTKKGSDNRNPAGFVLSEPRMGEIRADCLCPPDGQCLSRRIGLVLSRTSLLPRFPALRPWMTKRTNPVSVPPRTCFH